MQPDSFGQVNPTKQAL